MKLILASQSPRRKELLERTGAIFYIQPSQKEEVITKTDPAEVVLELAKQKAEDIATMQNEDCCVIGSDTVVAYENQILGKPKTKEDAFRMLSLLQGKIHQVYTGVSIVVKEKTSFCHTFYEKTEVSVYPMTDEQMKDYITTGEPMDKAGGYGIQGDFSLYIQSIQGDYNTVVGFPIARVYQELQKRGIDLRKQFKRK